ncbi:cell filamentation protein Fic, partial [Bacteroides fragilis]
MRRKEKEKEKEQVTVRSSAAEYLNYVASVGNDEQQIEIRYEDENIWLTQKLMAMLYGVEVHTINY